MSKTDLAMWQTVLRSKYGIPATEMDITSEDDTKSAHALIAELCDRTGLPYPLMTMRQQQQQNEAHSNNRAH